jgi:hypothetical protein
MSLSTKYNCFGKGRLLKVNSDDVVESIRIICRGPLGLTISGSEDVFEPIVVSDLCEGGLADKYVSIDFNRTK